MDSKWTPNLPNGQSGLHRAVSKWTRVGPPNGQGGLQMDKGCPNPPNAVSKWTRVGGLPTLQMDRAVFNSPTLQMDRAVSKWTRVGGIRNPRNLGRAPKGWGPPTLHDLQMDKFWGRPDTARFGVAGAPTLHDLRRRSPQPFRTWGGATPNPSPKIGKSMRGPFGPELPPNAKPKFCSGYNVWLWLGRI